MKILIIGASFSGIMLAQRLKELNPHLDIELSLIHI